jgi:hypothetical protein
LTVHCELDQSRYPKDIVVSDAEMATIHITRADFPPRLIGAFLATGACLEHMFPGGSSPMPLAVPVTISTLPVRLML